MDPPDSWDRYTVHSGGADLQCYRTGAGPSILLAHGWSDSSLRWVPLVDDLAKEYEIVAYDARGHGQSDAPESGYDLDSRIENLRTVVSESGIDNPVLIGHSMGVVTVARTAARHSDLVRGVVLEDPVGIHEVPDDDPTDRVTRVRDQVKQGREQSVEEALSS